MKLPIYYLPPIEWFSAYLNDGNPELDLEEPYHKQTCRNHCVIDSPQGRLKLTVPVINPMAEGHSLLAMKDVLISEHGGWHHKHWHAIETTYFNSPFFEYLQDDFRSVFFGQYKYLADFNVALIEKSLEFILGDMGSVNRYKELKKRSSVPCKPLAEYTQVFSHRHGFISGLSIIDLIFNVGNEAVLYL